MRVALIPPASLLTSIAGQPLHMIIPEGLKVPTYEDFYQIVAAQSGVTVMLDNGVYESVGNKPMSNEQLAPLIPSLGADIFTLPDRMGDAEATIKASRDFLFYWEMYYANALQNPPPVQFMAVLQGGDEEQMKRCAVRFTELEEEFEIGLMFAISKWTTEEIYPSIRIKLADWIAEHIPHPIHLFGQSGTWPAEMKHHNEYVISIDTAAPFVYAYEGVTLGEVPGPGRPANYFSLDGQHFPKDLVERNLEILWGWADGQSTQAS